MMMSQILRYVDFTKSQKPRYLENETLFSLQIKKIINYTSRVLYSKKQFCSRGNVNELDADGNVERYKARLVAQGYNQKYQIDYNETFCPVVRFELVQILIALAAKYKLQLRQLDVATAFLMVS